MSSILSWSQSPHGQGFALDCALCHSPENWNFDLAKNNFNHDSTDFKLSGQHNNIDCRSCHTSLEFKDVKKDCNACHIDIHQNTVGQDCARCHNSESWIVQEITALHEKTAFPLMGVHSSMDCNACHTTETNLSFAPTGVTCYDCHRSDYQNTIIPNHPKLGFDTDCASCHSLTERGWNTTIIDHSFFPLEKGHSNVDCASCHTAGKYDIPANCVSCHQTDFDNTSNPNHKNSGFSNDCISCHTLDPGWKPAQFIEHDANFFPIYSGKHKGVWVDCNQCHLNMADLKQFTCISCHKNPETNNEHLSITGYIYEDNACFACHPSGDADMAFDHNSTNFPLTGAHTQVNCISCHANGFQGTPTECVACHQTGFNQSLNPNHINLGLELDCKKCHTTQADWSPATFSDHNSFYELKGRHAMISNNCIECHNGDYNNTPNTCIGCHSQDFNDAKNPDHSLNQFSNDCITCHNESAWQPSTFNHDGLYFPIFSGKHNNVWSQCIECHTTPSDLTKFSCTTCHRNPETNDFHTSIPGYIYEDNACLACHPTGDASMSFNHNVDTNFPLTGAHTTVECISCHSNGFQGTPSSCVSCHQTDFNESVNPNHNQLNFNTDCISCHTTQSGWAPASLNNHNEFYALNGAHAIISNNCVSCHNGDYNNTPNTCFGCHNTDYNETTDPNHLALQFPTDCASCHSENAWLPSTFNHDGLYFPIYSGKHKGVWNQCAECHTNAGNWASFSCIACHINPETTDIHNGVPGYIYDNNACLACHPTGDGDVVFDHNTTMFPLTGAHTVVSCIECHSAGYQGTPSTCVSCHQNDFNQSANPNHIQLNLSTDCATCHTTQSGWAPASFTNHNEYYSLNGAHAAISNNCVSCHNGDYNSTPNTCVGCHNSDYNASTNPNHLTLQFPTDCASCHSENAWLPSTFNHDGLYFPIYSGKHQGVWNLCAECHTNTNNYSLFTCITCHQNPETNTEHVGVSGYSYNSPACLACHPTGDADLIFDHNTTMFPLTGAHVNSDCISCHASGYQGTPATCVSCHQTDFNQSVNPNHTQLNISSDCISCHTTAPGWAPASFDIHDNYYVLEGAHVPISNNCISCHNGDYNNTPNTCVGCHQSDFNATTNPNHETAMFGNDCVMCHSQSSWMPATFDHNIVYPLTGAHSLIASNCVLCHINGNYNNTPNTCVGCHQTDYNGTTNPNHGTLSLTTNCVSCHTTAPGWSPATFDNHNDFYILEGAHALISNNCIDCHNGNYNNTPNTCIGCHQSDFNATTNPDHEVNQFSNDCTSCHSQMAWAPSTFNHANVYPLLGAHATISNQCAMCHINGNYSTTPNTCIGCHQSDFNATTNPDHEVNQFSNDCTSCHSQTAWSPSTFNHANVYPLLGAHATISNQCAMCHINGNYSTTPNTCIGCHQSDFNATTSPDHEVNQFSNDCTSCHSQTAWSPSTFNHNSIYPFTGAHISIANQCNQCHINGNYMTTPNTCAGCHQPDYNASTNPNHASLNLSTDCVSCHTTAVGWMPASFDIHNNFYPIIGAHVGLACVTCHNGNYNNTPNTCVGCHISDYNSANDPNHQSAGFPQDCAACHSQNVWNPSTFDHDNMYFPIYSGKHKDEWNQCSECHTTPGNFSLFNCLNCHNNQSELLIIHQAVGGYQYNSNACYSCHPDGSG